MCEIEYYPVNNNFSLCRFLFHCGTKLLESYRDFNCSLLFANKTKLMHMSNIDYILYSVLCISVFIILLFKQKRFVQFNLRHF